MKATITCEGVVYNDVEITDMMHIGTMFNAIEDDNITDKEELKEMYIVQRDILNIFNPSEEAIKRFEDGFKKLLS